MRQTTITFKVTPEERDRIHQLAAKCGLTVSSYGRARMLGYRPKQRLTAEQIRLLGNLDVCCAAMTNFANFLSGMRKGSVAYSNELFRNYPLILRWYNEVASATNEVNNFMARVKAPSQTRLNDTRSKDDDRKG